MMYQVDLEDFSEFRINAFLSSPSQSISKKTTFRLWVAMVTKQHVAENWPEMTKIQGVFHT